MPHYDILVIGAGPAGASAAASAAKQGVKVLMIDRCSCIGEPVQCAEYIPLIFWRELSITGDIVSQKTSAMCSIYPSGREISTNAPGVMIDRAKFDRQLVMDAIRNGADLWLKTKVIKRIQDSIIIRQKGKENRLSAQVIIGADGPKSVIERSINSNKRRYIITYQCRTPLARKMDRTEIYFRPEFYGGYGWVFPKADIANVGIGVLLEKCYDKKSNIKILLEQFMDFLKRKRHIVNTPLSYTSGLIPCDGPVPQTVSNNVMLAGDAAGQTHPITGGGIPQAVMCGKLAGKFAAQAVESGDLEEIIRYDAMWRNRWGAELKRAVARRRELEANWDQLEFALDRCWITSKRYYEP